MNRLCIGASPYNHIFYNPKIPSFQSKVSAAKSGAEYLVAGRAQAGVFERLGSNIREKAFVRHDGYKVLSINKLNSPDSDQKGCLESLTANQEWNISDQD